MSKLTDDACRLIDQANEDEQRIILAYLRERGPLHPLEVGWNTTAEEILTAIARSSDLTLRGIRGILAEAIFEKRILPVLQERGWKTITVAGDQPYDFVLDCGGKQVKIQVKLQRREVGKPKEFAAAVRSALVSPPDGALYVVEVQKTRTGTRDGEDTRPYHFGDFDILAVNLHPVTGNWSRFMYTVGDWLFPRKQDSLIQIMQPVPIVPDEYWTDDLETCISWFRHIAKKRLYGGYKPDWAPRRRKK
jgi:hypothetical protein